MVYLLSKDFTKITETAGTIQNTSHICTVEMAASSVKGSGILIYPLHSSSFCGDNVYVRGVDGAAEVRVLSASSGLVTNAALANLPSDDDSDLADWRTQLQSSLGLPTIQGGD